VETAVNISFSCGHLKPNARQLYLTGHNTKETCLQSLNLHRLVKSFLHVKTCARVCVSTVIDSLDIIHCPVFI
jgi:hypothetical protein